MHVSSVGCIHFIILTTCSLGCVVLIPGVYLSLNDDIIPNHGYVYISDIGSTDDTALICHTNRPATLNNNKHSGGDWVGSNGMVVGGLTQGVSNVPGFMRDRDPMIVQLLRRTTTDPPLEGIFHCEVEDATFTQQTVYVGVYNSGGGWFPHKSRVRCSSYCDAILSGGVRVSEITLTVDSDLHGASPQFTLTCISTGGPATTVTWTRDPGPVMGNEMSILNDATTAQYTHTLTVTGRLGGLYTCTVSNDKPSEGSAQLDAQGNVTLWK